MPPVGFEAFPSGLDGELKLNRLGLARPRGARWPFAELVTGSDPADALFELALVILRRMRAAAVERGVAGDHRRELRREKVVVVLLDLGVDLERAVPERGRVRRAVPSSQCSSASDTRRVLQDTVESVCTCPRSADTDRSRSRSRENPHAAAELLPENVRDVHAHLDVAVEVRADIFFAVT